MSALLLAGGPPLAGRWALPPCAPWPVWTAWTRWTRRRDAKAPAPTLRFAEEGEPPKRLKRSEIEKRGLYLVECIKSGQPEKFDELAELFRTQIFSVAMRYCSQREDALDIMQNVLIRLYRALPAWEARSKLSTWIHRITMNAAIDFYRRHQKHEAQRVDPEAASAGDEPRVTSDPFLGISNETPRHVLARMEVLDAVHQALPKLSMMQRECFSLRHFHGMSVAEVAEALGCGEGSVKRHLFRASGRLRELLAHLHDMLESDTLTPEQESHS